MKQGRADRKGPTGQKVETTSKGVNPGAVSYLGEMLGNHVTDNGDVGLNKTPWRTTDGIQIPYKTGWDGSAPGAGMTTRKSGSQGKY